MESSSISSQSEKTNILALVSVVSGGLALLSALVSLVLSFLAAVPGFICASVSGLFALAAIVTGIIGLVQVNREGNTEKGKGLAIAGLALGVLGLLAACLVPVLSAFAVYNFSEMPMHRPRFWRWR